MLTATTATTTVTSVAVNPATGLGGPNHQRRTSAALVSGAIFVPAARNGGCAWESFGAAGFLWCRSADPRTVAPTSCSAAAGGDSSTKGVTTMAKLRLFPTRNPSARAAAHRAMAQAALFSDSSASTRLKRYNHHIDKARHLEAAVSGLEVRS